MSTNLLLNLTPAAKKMARAACIGFGEALEYLFDCLCREYAVSVETITKAVNKLSCNYCDGRTDKERECDSRLGSTMTVAIIGRAEVFRAAQIISTASTIYGGSYYPEVVVSSPCETLTLSSDIQDLQNAIKNRKRQKTRFSAKIKKIIPTGCEKTVWNSSHNWKRVGIIRR